MPVISHSEQRTSWVSQPGPPNKAFSKPPALWVLQQYQLALKEAAEMPSGMKELSGLIGMVCILIGMMVMWMYIHLSKLVRLYI